MKSIPSIENYRIYALIIEKISHSLRTPLGVSRGILKDASRGEQLEIIDFKDAFESSEKILFYLNYIKKVSSLIELDTDEQFSLTDVLPIEFSDSIQLKEKEKINFSKNKMKHILFCILNYFFEIKEDKDSISISTEAKQIEILVMNEDGLSNFFLDDFYKNIHNDGRLISISLLIVMLFGLEMKYSSLDDKMFKFSINLL